MSEGGNFILGYFLLSRAKSSTFRVELSNHPHGLAVQHEFFPFSRPSSHRHGWLFRMSMSFFLSLGQPVLIVGRSECDCALVFPSVADPDPHESGTFEWIRIRCYSSGSSKK